MLSLNIIIARNNFHRRTEVLRYFLAMFAPTSAQRKGLKIAAKWWRACIPIGKFSLVNHSCFFFCFFGRLTRFTRCFLRRQTFSFIQHCKRFTLSGRRLKHPSPFKLSKYKGKHAVVGQHDSTLLNSALKEWVTAVTLPMMNIGVGKTNHPNMSNVRLSSLLSALGTIQWYPCSKMLTYLVIG